MSTNVISSSATAIVIITRNDTQIVTIANTVTEKIELTSFDEGVNAVSVLLIKFMMIMVLVL